MMVEEKYPKRKQQLRGAALKNKIQAEQKAKALETRKTQLEAIDKLKEHAPTRLGATTEEIDLYFETHEVDEYGAPIPSVANFSELADEETKEKHHKSEEEQQNTVEEAFGIDKEQLDTTKAARHIRPPMYPWDAIEKAFVEGMPDETGAWHYPTIFDLKTMFGVAYVQTRRKIAQGGWVKKRDEWRQKLQTQIKEQSMLDLVSTANRFDDKCIELAERGIGEILDHFYTAKAEGETLSSAELDRLGRAAISLQKVGRLALGLPTENTDTRIETRNADPFATLDLSNLTNEQIEELKNLLHQSEKTVESTLINQ